MVSIVMSRLCLSVGSGRVLLPLSHTPCVLCVATAACGCNPPPLTCPSSSPPARAVAHPGTHASGSECGQGQVGDQLWNGVCVWRQRGGGQISRSKAEPGASQGIYGMSKRADTGLGALARSRR